MWRHADIQELVTSIAQSGWMPFDDMVVLKTEASRPAAEHYAKHVHGIIFSHLPAQKHRWHKRPVFGHDGPSDAEQ